MCEQCELLSCQSEAVHCTIIVLVVALSFLRTHKPILLAGTDGAYREPRPYCRRPSKHRHPRIAYPRRKSAAPLATRLLVGRCSISGAGLPVFLQAPGRLNVYRVSNNGHLVASRAALPGRDVIIAPQLLRCDDVTMTYAGACRYERWWGPGVRRQSHGVWWLPWAVRRTIVAASRLQVGGCRNTPLVHFRNVPRFSCAVPLLIPASLSLLTLSPKRIYVSQFDFK